MAESITEKGEGLKGLPQKVEAPPPSGKEGVDREKVPEAELKVEAEEITKEVKEVVETVEKASKEVSLKEALSPQAQKVVEVSTNISKNENHPAHYLFKDRPITQELIQKNPDAAFILLQMAQAPKELHNNPTWLMKKGLELGKAATPETQLEVDRYLDNILERIEEIWDNEPEKLQNLKENLKKIEEEYGIDLKSLGKEFSRERLRDAMKERLGKMAPPEGAILPEKKDEREAALRKITTSEVRDIVERLDRRIKRTQEGARDERFWSHALDDLNRAVDEASRGKSPEEKDRIEEEAKKFLDELSERKGMARERVGEERRVAQLKELEERGIIIYPREVNAKGERPIIFRWLSETEVNRLKKGPEGEKEFFNLFMKEQEMMVRDPLRLELPDIQKMDEFWEYLKWRYGPEEGLVQEQYWRGELTHRKELHFAMVELYYRVGAPRDILSALGRIRPEDLEFLTKGEFCQYTIPMVEEEAMIMLEEKLVRWKELDQKKVKEERLARMKDIEKRLKGELTPKEREERNREYGKLGKDQIDWEQGVWLTDDDLQGNFEKFRMAQDKLVKILWERKEKDPVYRELIERKEGLTGEKREKLDQEIEAYEQKIIAQELTAEDQMWLKRGYYSNLEWRVREKLIEFLEKKDIAFKDWQIDKALSLGMKFNVFFRLPNILAYYYIEPKTAKERMRALPFEDLVRILNPESYFFRFNMGGKLGETTRSLLQSMRLGDKATKVELTKTPEWKAMEDSGIPIIETRRRRLEMIEEKLGIPWSELLRGGVANIGMLFDATGWRAEIGIWDEIIEYYSKMGKDHREFALGLQLSQFAAGEAALEAEGQAIREADELKLTGKRRDEYLEKRKKVLTEGTKAQRGIEERKKIEIFEKIIRREPLLLAQVMANDKIELVAEYKDKVDWQKLEKALQFAQMEMTTERTTEVELRDGRKIAVDFGNEDFFRKVCVEGKYLEVENWKDYLSFVRDLQARAKSKKEELANFPYAMTLTLTDVPWKDTNWIGIGKIACDRRLARDIPAASGFRDALFKLWMNPSPLKWEETAETIMEGRKSMIDYGAIGPAEEWARDEAKFSIAFNENRLRRIINWFPGLETAFRNLEGISKTLGIDNEKARKMLESFSYSVLFYGPTGNAWVENDIVVFTNFLRRLGAFTEHPEYAEKILKWSKSDLPWRALAFVRTVWFPAVMMMIAMLFKQTIEEEEK